MYLFEECFKTRTDTYINRYGLPIAEVSDETALCHKTQQLDRILNWVHWSVNQSYLLSTDPDAPSRANPVRREFRHWLVGNIPGDKVDQGETFTEYVGSGPPRDTGKIHKFRLQHRFVLLSCWMGSWLIAALRIKFC